MKHNQRRQRLRIIRRSMKILSTVIVALVLIEAFRLVLLKRQVGQYRTYWQQQAQRPAEANALWYVAFGDSVAQGIGASQPQKGYVGLIVASLQQKTGRSVHVINLSVSGTKISDALTIQLPKFKALKLPQDTVVTVEIGANDMTKFEATNFQNQFEELLKMLPPQSVVADVPYFGGGLFRGRERSVIVANQIIDKLLAKYNFRKANLHQTTQQHDSLLNYGADLFHPSDKGYQNWYQAFWQILQG